jgi:hypothetical protein
MALLANDLVATDASSTLTSCVISNANGCNFSLASGGGTLNATMAHDLSSSGNPQFTNVTATGQLNASATTSSTSTTTGAVVTAGGMGVAKNMTVGGQINNTNTTNSTSRTTGAIVTAGGLGVGGRISCHGINFGGDTLGTYTGTTSWTPTISFGSFISPSLAYTSSGNYTVIGSMVFCSFIITLSNKGASSGNALIGLPFRASSAFQPTQGLGIWSTVTFNSGYTQAVISPNANGSTANLNQSSSSSSSGYLNLTYTNFSNTSIIQGGFYYYI